MEYNHYSASYDVDMAKKYGLEAAALFNKLVYLSRYTSREDGFCWKTSKELEDELGISRYQQDRAIKLLENAGLIETKVTYIQGTLNRCKHFKLTDSSISEMQETDISLEMQETRISEVLETDISLSNNHTIEKKSNNNIYTEFEKEFISVWKIYPRKEGKTNALKAYVKARKEGETQEEILSGLKRYLEQIKLQNTESKFIKHGSTWFNQRCWHDDYKNELDIINEGRSDEFRIIKIEKGNEYGGETKYFADGFIRKYDAYGLMMEEIKSK